jgi:DNA-directed RNA polymerase subunit E'
MYLVVENEDIIRIPPLELSEDIDEIIHSLACEKLEGRLGIFDDSEKIIEEEEKKYLILKLLKVDKIGDGAIVHGDGAVYQRIKYTAIAYNVKLQEVIEGEVIDILKFGAFIRFGPLDGLLHISQIMDDRLDVDVEGKRFIGKDTKRFIKVGDKIRARIVALSINDKNPKESKIGLTMRQLGLGKLEWLKENKNKEKEEPKKKVKSEKKKEK